MLGWHGSLLKSFSSPLLKYLSYFTCSQEWFRAGLGIWVSLLYWYWLVFLHYNWPSEEVVLFCCVNSDSYTKDGVNCPLSLGHLETKIRAEHILLFRSWFWLVTTQFQLPLKKKKKHCSWAQKLWGIPWKCGDVCLSLWAAQSNSSESAELLHPLQRLATFPDQLPWASQPTCRRQTAGVVTPEKHKVSISAVGRRGRVHPEDLLSIGSSAFVRMEHLWDQKGQKHPRYPFPSHLFQSFSLPALWHNSSL